MTFVLSKIFWWLANPATIGLMLLCAGATLTWTPRRRLGQWLLSLLAVTALAIAVLPVGRWLMQPLEDRFPPPAVAPGYVDGIIVLGGIMDMEIGQAHLQPALTDTADRFTALMALARRYPEAALVFTGGTATIDGRGVREAPAIGGLAGLLGLGPERLRLDPEARNTHENALFTRQMMAPKPGQRWLLVTSAWHMPRAIGVFRRAGWPVIAYPVDYRTMGERGAPLQFDLLGGLRLVDTATKEWIGLVVYRMLGRTDALFPAPQ